jgi:RimJ/RimL family protein N-acetyltransferase
MIDPNLRIEGYGVALCRLTRDKIEMVRQWRNDPKIQQYMIFRETITPEMQEKWFERVNNDSNLYFIIVHKGQEIGLINIKDIDYNAGIGEGGIFIYDEQKLGSDISYRAHLVLFDYVFFTLHLNAIRSKILISNQRASRFASFLGSRVVGSIDDNVELYLLSKEDYFSNLNRERFIRRWKYYNE